MKKRCLALMMVLYPTFSLSAPLSERQLLDMKAAGIGEKVIIHQVETDGIAFPVGAGTLIALKKAGFSDALLNALLNTKDSAKPGANAASLPAASTPTTPTTLTSPVAAAPVSPAPQQMPPSLDAQLGQQCTALDKEVDSIEKACERIGKHKNFGPIDATVTEGFFEDHCNQVNACPLVKRMFEIQMDHPNACSDAVRNVYPLYCNGKEFYSPSDVKGYRNIQVLQSTDSSLMCGDLKVETSDLEEDVAQLSQGTRRLNGEAQTYAQNAQTANAMASVTPLFANSLIMMSSAEQSQSESAAQKGATVQQVLDTYQKRHDYLMQIYFQRGCKDVAALPLTLSAHTKAVEDTEARIVELQHRIDSIDDRCSAGAFGLNGAKPVIFDKACHKGDSQCQYRACAAEACKPFQEQQQLAQSEIMKSVVFAVGASAVTDQCSAQ